MTRYTLSFLDSQGRALQSESLDCATDAEAINALHDRRETRHVQLWRENQKILDVAVDTRPRRQHVRHMRRSPPWAAAISTGVSAGF